MTPLLEIRNLSIAFQTEAGLRPVVKDLSLMVEAGQTLGIVGESGSGKSVTAQAIIRLWDPQTTQVSGQILFDGINLLDLSDSDMQQIRGKSIGMIFQDPMTSLNPTMSVGGQVIEALRHHNKGLSAAAARTRAIALFRMVGIADPESRVDLFPHHFSGGMRQRVMIAIALSCGPQLLIADEPTTALDVTIQAQILELLKQIKREHNTSLILISHDLGVIAGTCDRVAVMHQGSVVEYGDVDQIFYRPQHPYTQSLLRMNLDSAVERSP